MNSYDDINDDDVLRATSAALAAIPLAQPPDPHAIMTRGRARRRTRLTIAGVAASALVAAGAAGLLDRVNAAHTPGTTGPLQPSAFTLVKYADGTSALTLHWDTIFNPDELQQALARNGIPALVKINASCSSYPTPPSAESVGVISYRLPNGDPVPFRSFPRRTAGSHPGDRNQERVNELIVINPAALPSGAELFFDYLDDNHQLISGLIYANSYACTSGTPNSSTGHGGQVRTR